MSNREYIESIIPQLKRIPDLPLIYTNYGKTINYCECLTESIQKYLISDNKDRNIYLISAIHFFKEWYFAQKKLGCLTSEMLHIWKPTPFPISKSQLETFSKLDEIITNQLLYSIVHALIDYWDFIPTFAHGYLMNERWGKAIDSFASLELKEFIQKTLYSELS